MALVVNDRVKETSTTTGTVTFNLDGAVTGFETFSSAIGNGNTTYYAIEIPNTTEFEVGLGTIAAGTLARTTVISSSNSDSLVNFSAGTKNVFCTLPASKAVIEDASNNVTLPADLTVDTNTLHVDSSNNRVGINTTSPTQALTIDGGNLAKIQFLGGGFQSIYYGDSGSATAAFVHYDHSSDNYQVDVSGTITLDAPTSIKLSDNGTQFGQLEDSSNDFVISSVVSDKDLIFKGNDGGSTITALTFDMSEAGAATFNAGITATTGTISGDLTVDTNTLHVDSSNNRVGIGTTSPTYTLESLGSSTDGAFAVFHNQGSGGVYSGIQVASDNLLGGSNSDTNLIMTRWNGVGTKVAAVKLGVEASNNDGVLTFSTAENADLGSSTYTERMRIDGDTGNVGIGTTSPARDLQIAKSTSGGTVRLEVNNESNTGASNGVISIYSGGTSGGDPYLHFKVDNGEQYSIGIDNDQSDALVFSNSFGVGSNNLLSIATDGATTFTDKIILGANKVIEFGDAGENISGDGTDLTIASSNKIILNADGAGQVFFKDGGTNLAKLFVSSQVFTLETIVSDGDFAIKGNDGGSTVTALTLDMSEAGAATFNDKIILGANKAIEFGNAGESISGDGTDMTITGNIVKIDAANRIILDAAENRIDLHDNGSEFARFVNNGGQLRILTGSSAATAVSFDSSGAATFNDKIILGANKSIEFGDSGETITGDGTAITVASSEDITLDAASEINLDAGSDSIRIKDDGTEYGRIHRVSGGGLIIKSQESNKDIQFQGVDGGSSVTALTLDMSEAGAATFNDKVILGANKSIEFGDAGETISGDGTDLTIASSNKIILNADGAGQVFFKDGGTNLAKLFVSSQVFTLETIVSDGDFAIKGNDNGSSVTALTLDMSEAGAATFNDKIILGANKAIEFGDAGESISGDGTDMTITGNIVKIDAANRIILDAAENRIDLHDNGSEFARFVNNGGQLRILTGSSAATAVSFDSSGAATFNDKVILGANKVIEFGDAGETISGDGTNLTIASSGFFLLDVTGNILLDSANNGFIALRDNGTSYINFSENSGNAILNTPINDGDFFIKGNDGGSEITALTLDMSEAGAATFNSDVTVGSKLKLPTNTANKILVADGTSFEEVDISGDATIASGGTLTLANSGVSAASYTNSSITVDAKGRVTAASSGAAGVSAGFVTAMAIAL